MRSAAEDRDFIAQALERFRIGADAREKQYRREREDLEFQVPEKQWEEDVRKARGAQTVAGVPVPARPMLSVAAVDEPIQLAANQQRAAELGVHVHALNEDATDETAKVIEGLYRNIESDSRANVVRSWSYDRALWCGLGFYCIDKVQDPFGGHWTDQKLILRRILHQGELVPDPFAKEPDWSDGEWLHDPTMLRFTTFKRKYPKAKLTSFTDEGLTALNSGSKEGWIGGDSPESRAVRISKYWRVQITSRTKVLLDDNSDAYEDEIPDGRTRKTGKDARSMDLETRKVYCTVMDCEETLEEYEWDGQYIPYVPVIWRELQPFDHERRWAGMMTNAKDGARLTNYAASGAVEMSALEPKAPWLGVEGTFAGHESEFQQAAVRNFPYLQYNRNGLDGQAVPPPARVQVDVARMGPNMQLLAMGKDFVQSAMATFDPSLGKQPTAHRSGRALEALQGQTINATSHGLDNLANISMMYESRVILDLMPRVYDRPGRIAQIRDEAGLPSQVVLNQPHVMGPDGTPQPVAPDAAGAKTFDLAKGRYGTAVTIGKSSASRLQEGTDALGQILQADPNLIQLVGPEWMHFQDFPGAQAVADILKKNRDHMFPWVAPDPQGDPTLQLAQAKQQLQQMQQQLQQASQAIATEQAKYTAQADIAKYEADCKERLAVLLKQMDDATKIKVARITAAKEGMQDGLAAVEERIALMQSQTHDANQNALDRAHDVGLAAQDHSHTTQQADQQQQNTLEQGQQQADLAPEPAASDGGAGAQE